MRPLSSISTVIDPRPLIYFCALSALFVSYSTQAISAWIIDGFVVSSEGVNERIATYAGGSAPAEDDSQENSKGDDIFELVRYRYICPAVVSNDKNTQHVSRRIPKNIDRTVWPANFVHTEDIRNFQEISEEAHFT